MYKNRQENRGTLRIGSWSGWTKVRQSQGHPSRVNGRHTELFFAVKPEITEYNDDLADQGDPEQRLGHRTARNALRKVPGADVGEHGAGSDRVGCRRTRDHDTDCTNDLGQHESRTDVETR